MKKLFPLLITSFLAWLPTTDAQLTISGEDVVVCDNGTVSIDVSVSNFIDITSVQFAATWDPDVVQFTSVLNNMPASALYNTGNASNGELRFSWFDANPPPGYTPPGPPVGSQIIFTINFNIVGDYTTDNFTDINFGSVLGFTMEIASTSGIILNSSVVIDTGSVTIDDAVPPTITCPANVTVTAALGQNSAVVTYPAPTFTDNCGGVTTNCSPASGATFPVGTTTVTCNATDGAGNNATPCTFTITVNAPPPNPNALIITADDVGLNCNVTDVDIPIRVKNFDQMTSAQFAVVWDPTVLEYDDSTDFINATGHGTALYNSMNAPAGQFRFSWFDSDGVPGEDLPDSTVIFTLHFTLLNENDLPDTVSIGSLPGFPVEFSDIGGILGIGDYAFEYSVVSLLPDTQSPVITCPANQTLNANASCQATLDNYIGLATATDNCTAAMNIVITQLPTAGTVITDTTEVMLIAEDEAGNKDTCFFDVNFVDNTDPVITCPSNASVGNDLGECSAIVALVATATDNCGVLSLTDNGPVGDEFPVGTTTVTFTATDVNGNTANCQTTVTVADTEDPSITCPANISLGTDAGDCTTVVTWAAPSATDNCPNITVTCTPPSGTTFPIGDSTIVCIVEDQAGNLDTCTFIVTVFDDEAPVITCPADQTVFADTICEATLPDFTLLATATDNCTDSASIVITQLPAAGTVITDTTEVMMIAEDIAGLLDTCFFDVNFVDSLPPTITCPANDTLDVDSSECFATLLLPVATASDNCGVFSITDNGPASDEFPVGTTTVTFTATDVNGNTATCLTTVVVIDTIAPVITCPANILQGTDVGDCTAVVTWAAPTVVDNCTTFTVTCTPPSGTSFPVGDSTVVCIVQDQSGQKDTCDFVVTVFDDEAPALQCRADTTIIVPAGTVDTVINDIYLFFLGDNCGVSSSYYEFTGAIPNGGGPGSNASGTTPFPVGTTTVTYFAEDAAGNIDSCFFDVIIVEDIILTLNCPPNQTVANSAGNCGALVNGLTADVSPLGAAVDSFYLITGATIGNGLGLNASGGFNVGVSTVTFFAVSVGGDTVSCSTIVTVNDTQAPVFTNCPAGPVTMGNTTDECGLRFNGAIVPVATDNCPGVTFSYNFAVGSLIPLGTNTVTATATDASNNVTTCTYTLVVTDNQSPKFLGCQNGSTITRNNDLGQCGAVVAWAPLVTAQDNCVLLALSETSPGNGDFFPVGNTTVTYTAVDNKGNVATCEINITIIDNQSPLLLCPGNQPPVNTALNQCSATVNFSPPVSSDNCGVINFGPITPVGPVFDEGTHTLTYEATDAAGNMTACSFTVTVVDNQFPFIPFMPADLTVFTAPGDCGAIVNWSPPSYPIDNCGIETFGPSGGAPGDFFGVGVHVVKYVAMDINGNITVESLNITVQDDTPPVINCPGGLSISVDGFSIDDPDGLLTGAQPVDCDNIELDLEALTAADACGIFSFVQTAGLPSGSPFPVGATTMSYQATDNYGNTSNCSFVINVLDFQLTPATVSQGLVCEGGSVTFSVGTLPGATYTWTTGGNVVSNQPIFVITNAALNQSGIYTAVVSTGYCDIEFVTELNVSAVPVVTIDANDILCASNGLPLVLSGTNSSTANVTSWVWTFPDGSVHAGQTQTVQNPDIPDSGIYCVTATTAFGCETTECEQIDVLTGPTTPVVNGTTANTCLGTEFTLFGQLYSGNNVTYHWYSIPAAGSGLQSINNPIVSVEPTVAGNYTYFFYVTVDGCISDIAEWAVTVEAAPTIVLDVVGQTQCVDGNSDVTLCDIGTGATEWMWFAPFGPLPGNSSCVVLQNVNPSFSGTYTVIAKSASGNCVSTATTQITITSAPSPTAQLTASETAICEGGLVTLTGTQYTGVVDYIWTGPNIPPNSQNNNIIDVFPSFPNGPGNYDYSFTALVNGCYTETAFVTVVVSSAPALDIDVVGDLDCVDGTSSITLSTAATGLSAIEWTDGNGNVLSNANPLVLSNVDATDSGPIFLAGTNLQGCTGYGSIFLNITDGIDGLTATSTMVDCELGVLSLEASTITNASYTWFKPNDQIFAITQNATLANATDGVYTVVAQVGGCTDTATVNVDVANLLEANDKLVVGMEDIPQEFNILANDIHEAGQPFTITILQQGTNGTVAFTHDSIYTYTPNPGYWGSDFIIYEICYTECSTLCATALVTFDIKPDPVKCAITTVISPNDDGYNDEFIVSCASANPSNTLLIFNQWGDKVYEAAPYNNDWKGTHDGRDLPDGTYFYIFQRDSDTPPQKGFVMIYR